MQTAAIAVSGSPGRYRAQKEGIQLAWPVQGSAARRRRTRPASGKAAGFGRGLGGYGA